MRRVFSAPVDPQPARPAVRYEHQCGVVVIGLMLAACGSDVPEAVVEEPSAGTAETEANRETVGRSADPNCSNTAEFTLRVVYNVTNTYMREELRALGAPTQARGIERRELIIRDQARLIRRTGKTYMDDPVAIKRSDDEWDNEIAGIQSSGEYMTRSLQWKHARSKIEKVILPIDWVDYRAPPGQTSYRYGLDPMAPLIGEKWREDDDLWDSDEARDLLAGSDMVTLSPSVMNGVTVSKATYAGHECEMLRRQTDARINETCTAVFDGRSVLLHGMDKSATGSMTETAESVELGLCVSDSMLAAPGRIQMDNLDRD